MKASSSETVAGWNKVVQRKTYSARTGFGWSSSANIRSGDGGGVPAGAGDPAVLADYAYGSTAATFKVFVGANEAVTVKISSYGPALLEDQGVAANIGNGPTSTLVGPGDLTLTSNRVPSLGHGRSKRQSARAGACTERSVTTRCHWLGPSLLTESSKHR